MPRTRRFCTTPCLGWLRHMHWLCVTDGHHSLCALWARVQVTTLGTRGSILLEVSRAVCDSERPVAQLQATIDALFAKLEDSGTSRQPAGEPACVSNTGVAIPPCTVVSTELPLRLTFNRCGPALTPPTRGLCSARRYELLRAAACVSSLRLPCEAYLELHTRLAALRVGRAVVSCDLARRRDLVR